MLIARDELADILRIDAEALPEMAASHRLPFAVICGEFCIEHGDLAAWNRALTWKRNLR